VVLKDRADLPKLKDKQESVSHNSFLFVMALNNESQSGASPRSALWFLSFSFGVRLAKNDKWNVPASNVTQCANKKSSIIIGAVQH